MAGYRGAARLANTKALDLVITLSMPAGAAPVQTGIPLAMPINLPIRVSLLQADIGGAKPTWYKCRLARSIFCSTRYGIFRKARYQHGTGLACPFGTACYAQKRTARRPPRGGFCTLQLPNIRGSGLFNLELAARSSAHTISKATENESARGKTGRFPLQRCVQASAFWCKSMKKV
jgi:hypothetical protein